MPGRPEDKKRILRLLIDTEGLSNNRIKTELSLTDDRYNAVREELINEGLVEKYVCKGGGLRLTRKGEKENGTQEDVSSGVENESGLYKPFGLYLETQAEQDGVEAVICPTYKLKARGKWRNPDVTRVAIEFYRHLRKVDVTVTTYEVKQFPNWNVSAVYEAASHHRFSHEAYVVLEWPNDVEFSLTDPTYKLDQMARECRRHGVGLATLHPWYKSYRLRTRIEPDPKIPEDEDVELWLDYVFSRNTDARDAYHHKFSTVQKELNALTS